MMCALQMKPGLSLQEILHDVIELPNEYDCQVTGITLDSRNVGEGDVFIAVPGDSVDGRYFIDEAIANGARAVLWQPPVDTQAIPLNFRQSEKNSQSIPVIAIANLKRDMGLIASRYYAAPSENMFVVAITGTNGKTSVSQFIAQALGAEKSAVIGTNGWGRLGELQTTTHTTPDAVRLHEWLSDIRASGCEQTAIEVSSHALSQYRISGVAINCAVFTNLTRDHLDYHGDMDNYGKAKAALFDVAGLDTAVINIDDDFGLQLACKLEQKLNLLTYGLKCIAQKPDIYATNIRHEKNGIKCNLHTPSGDAEIRLNIFGDFNLLNALATVGVLLHKGLSVDLITEALAKIEPIDGRMQYLRAENKPLVIIDYAHTPDALENVLKAVKEHTQGELYVVFGCGGNRDKGKRALMGGIAEALADYIILTNDNPRDEIPADILKDISAGINDNEKIYIEIDRHEAIQYAIRKANENDVVVVAGKGHETYQIIGDKKSYFSDIDEVRLTLSGDSS